MKYKTNHSHLAFCTMLALAFASCGDDSKPNNNNITLPPGTGGVLGGGGGAKGTGGSKGTGGATAPGTGGATAPAGTGGATTPAGTGGTTPAGTGGSGPADADPNPAPDAPVVVDMAPPPPDVAPPTGTTITGTISGAAFNQAPSALWVGKPDDDGTTLVYLFSNTVTCAGVGSKGWEATLPDDTQVLELRLIGETALSYPVNTNPQGNQAEATHTNGDGAAVPAQSGTIVLAAVTAGQSAAGTFNLTFAQGSLSGTFVATHCPNGVEP